MTIEPCAEMELLIQADCDGELSPTEAAKVALHVASCPDCATLQATVVALSRRLRTEIAYRPMPPGSRERVLARIAAERAPEASGSRSVLARLGAPRLRTIVPFGGGFALAACVILALMLPRDDGFTGSLVADHIRALQPGHLMDVVSTDQHTVKPWFDGRIDFAPPVKDLRLDGFPLTGGRLDYLADRAVAVLVYQRRLHIIDLYVSPDSHTRAPASEAFERSGYHVLGWHQDGMSFWAVSDLNETELTDFVRLWRAAV